MALTTSRMNLTCRFKKLGWFEDRAYFETCAFGMRFVWIKTRKIFKRIFSIQHLLTFFWWKYYFMSILRIFWSFENFLIEYSGARSKFLRLSETFLTENQANWLRISLWVPQYDCEVFCPSRFHGRTVQKYIDFNVFFLIIRIEIG